MAVLLIGCGQPEKPSEPEQPESARKAKTPAQILEALPDARPIVSSSAPPAQEDFFSLEIKPYSNPTPKRPHNGKAFETIHHAKLVGLNLTLNALAPEERLATLYDREDLQRVEIQAESLTIRGPVHFPGADLIIHAGELIFEDLGPGKPGCLITTPLPFAETNVFTKRQVDRALALEHPNYKLFEPVKGQAAGNMRIQVGRLFADPGPDGPVDRFVLKGGTGAPGYPGYRGTHGEKVEGSRHTHEGLRLLYVVDFRKWYDHQKIYRKRGMTLHRWPSLKKKIQGYEGFPPQSPGIGGPGGNLQLNLDPEQIEDMVDLSPGYAGSVAEPHEPAEVGSPTNFYVKFIEGSDKGKIEHLQIRRLKPMVAPGPEEFEKEPGDLVQIEAGWIAPEVLTMSAEWVRRLYLMGHSGQALRSTSRYMRDLDRMEGDLDADT
ncbi:MAG: hypothetical protein AAF492_24005, partial [Verrucomicrobiota bacterium]